MQPQCLCVFGFVLLTCSVHLAHAFGFLPPTVISSKRQLAFTNGCAYEPERVRRNNFVFSLVAMAKRPKGGKKENNEKDPLQLGGPAQILAPSKPEKQVETVGEASEKAVVKTNNKKTTSGIGSGLRFKLLEEQAQPFRRLRQFLYIAAGGSAGIGSFVSGSRVIAALTGVQGVQPLSETVPNTAINLGVVAVSVALWIWEDKRGKGLLDKITERSGARQQLAALPVELSDGETSDLRGLRDRYRVIILAGTAAEVTRAINLAGRQGEELARLDVLVVPYFTDLADDSEGWRAMRDSSVSGTWDAWLARPRDLAAFSDWLAAERARAAEAAGNPDPAAAASDRLLRVFVIRRDGKIGARTVGPPAWPKLVAQIRALPIQDEYGTP